MGNVLLVVRSARTDLRGGVVVLLLECGHGGRGRVGDGVGDLAVQPAHVAAHERIPAPDHREGSASLFKEHVVGSVVCVQVGLCDSFTIILPVALSTRLKYAEGVATHQWFLTWLSVRPGRRLAISLHLLPSSLHHH
jgi:hypothetical protein